MQNDQPDPGNSHIPITIPARTMSAEVSVFRLVVADVIVQLVNCSTKGCRGVTTGLAAFDLIVG